MKRGSCCLLIVKLGICIPYGDLTIQLVLMVFPLWVIFSYLGQSIPSQLFSFKLSALFFLYIPIFEPSPLDILFFDESRISIDSAEVLRWCFGKWFLLLHDAGPSVLSMDGY